MCFLGMASSAQADETKFWDCAKRTGDPVTCAVALTDRRGDDLIDDWIICYDSIDHIETSIGGFEDQIKALVSKGVLKERASIATHVIRNDLMQSCPMGKYLELVGSNASSDQVIKACYKKPKG